MFGWRRYESWRLIWELISMRYVEWKQERSHADDFQADPSEPNFQQAFWGDNYPRLLEIKRKVDPTDVFWCTPCVGNERWHVVDDVLCKV
jgi:hypothetical protein